LVAARGRWPFYGWFIGGCRAERSDPMVIGCLQVSLSIPDSNSLKDKRMVLRSLKDRMLNKMNVSVAEVEHQDTWKTCGLAIVTVAAEKHIVESRFAEVLEFIRSNPMIVMIDCRTEMI
jgi:uncharacterized protein